MAKKQNNDQMKNEGWIDLGSGHRVKFVSWSCDRKLNPWAKDVPDIEKMGLIDEHPAQNDILDEKGNVVTRKGEKCGGAVYFDSPEYRILEAAQKKHAEELGKTHREHPTWTVESLEPASLHIEPSLLCKPPQGCGDHGFIRGGKWEVA